MNSKTLLGDADRVLHTGHAPVTGRGDTAARQPDRAHRLRKVADGGVLTRVRVWDLPLRLFHWSLVAAVSVAIVSGEIGGDLMDIHAKAGLTILALLAFRLVWGCIGSTHARFLNFVPTAASLRAYLRGRWHGHGHSPLGALAVLALLALLAAQAGTGLFGSDDIAFTGPLYGWVEEALALRLTGMHRQLANVLLALVALHIAAILVYLLVKKVNLVKPMLTGWKDVHVEAPQGVVKDQGKATS